MRVVVALAAIPLVAAVAAGWFSNSRVRIAAAGTIAGQRVDTTVDSELARDYLSWLSKPDAGSDSVAALRSRLAVLDREPLTAESLGVLTRETTIDVATLYFVDRLWRDPENRRAQQAFHELVASLRERVVGAKDLPAELRAHLIVFVPGYAYELDTTTGADFARQRDYLRRAGLRAELLRTGELASVEDNAVIVADAVRRWGLAGERLILVSASKGGPEVEVALGTLLDPAETRHVAAWISIGGLLRGSPYADRFLNRPRRWLADIGMFFTGLDSAVIPSLSTVVRRAAPAARIPGWIRTVQYIGAPLSGHIGGSVGGRYGTIAPLGPNDGLTLLADELVPGGIALTAVGLDHYYRDPEIDIRSLAMAYIAVGAR